MNKSIDELHGATVAELLTILNNVGALERRLKVLKLRDEISASTDTGEQARLMRELQSLVGSAA